MGCPWLNRPGWTYSVLDMTSWWDSKHWFLNLYFAQLFSFTIVPEHPLSSFSLTFSIPMEEPHLLSLLTHLPQGLAWYSPELCGQSDGEHDMPQKMVVVDNNQLPWCTFKDSFYYRSSMLWLLASERSGKTHPMRRKPLSTFSCTI